MQRNANIEQTSEINKDFFVISQRVKQIFAVYCKYAKNSKESAFLQILWVSLQKCSPLSVPRINFCPSEGFCNTLNTNRLNSEFCILCGQIKTLASESKSPTITRGLYF